MFKNGFPNKKSKGDLYRTPNILTRMLLNNLVITSTNLIDPCAGYGDILNELKRQFKTKLNRDYLVVSGSDIEPRGEGITKGDFMDLDLSYNQQIITNPPYSLSTQFLGKFKGKEMALLLPTVYLNTSSRFEYFKYLTKLITFNRKLNLTTWHGGEVVDAGAVSYSWFIFEADSCDDCAKKSSVTFSTTVLDINPYIKRVGK